MEPGGDRSGARRGLNAARPANEATSAQTNVTAQSIWWLAFLARGLLCFGAMRFQSASGDASKWLFAQAHWVTLIGGMLAVAAVGCSPQDPVWALSCADRTERSVEVGTGQGQFVDADAAPLEKVFGGQGGEHIWMAVRLTGFGPTAQVTHGIRDAENDTEYSGPLQDTVQLHYNGAEDASEAAGMFGFLSFESDPSGRDVVLWAKVSDQCGVIAEGEANGTVE